MLTQFVRSTARQCPVRPKLESGADLLSMSSAAAKAVRDILQEIAGGVNADGSAGGSRVLSPTRRSAVLRHLEKMLEEMGAVLTESSPPLGNVRQLCRLIISSSYDAVLPGFSRLIMAHEGALVRV